MEPACDSIRFLENPDGADSQSYGKTIHCRLEPKLLLSITLHRARFPPTHGCNARVAQMPRPNDDAAVNSWAHFPPGSLQEASDWPFVPQRPLARGAFGLSPPQFHPVRTTTRCYTGNSSCKASSLRVPCVLPCETAVGADHLATNRHGYVEWPATHRSSGPDFSDSVATKVEGEKSKGEGTAAVWRSWLCESVQFIEPVGRSEPQQ
jgi:hypothetical protein